MTFCSLFEFHLNVNYMTTQYTLLLLSGARFNHLEQTLVFTCYISITYIGEIRVHFFPRKTVLQLLKFKIILFIMMEKATKFLFFPYFFKAKRLYRQ